MTTFAFCKKRQGQTIVEYTLVIGIVIAIFLALSPMIQRGTQGMVKVVADEVGFQKNAEQQGNIGLISSEIKTNLARQQQRQEWQAGATHSVKISYNETTGTETQSDSSLGVAPE